VLNDGVAQIVELLLSYGGLFAWSFLAATILPLASEVPLAALVYAQRQIALPVIAATAGNYLGACTTYWIGYRAARALRPAYDSPRYERAARLLRRYGQPALLLSWVPLIGDVLVVVAGATAVPFKGFSFWVILGKDLRYLSVALATRALWP
jgi:membrane protein YqaA with SNARE-associated domain